MIPSLSTALAYYHLYTNVFGETIRASQMHGTAQPTTEEKFRVTGQVRRRQILGT